MLAAFLITSAAGLCGLGAAIVATVRDRLAHRRAIRRRMIGR